MNTWNSQVASELSEAMLKANTDDEVRAVVLTGAGRAFCAGADLEEGAILSRIAKKAVAEER